ncbi:MAG: hypothetical protein HYY78_10935 [Betaproteobacteria bacterium]|nr:hypothetical protein [Betaproteobacteria bacterium]
MPIRVRLEPMPLAGSDGPTRPGRIAPLEERTIKRAAAVSEVTARQVSPEPPAGVTQGTDLPLALPPVPDQTVFSARDLDVYPAPVAPFDVDRVAARVDGDAAGEVRLEVLIDEHGRVKEIAFAEPRTLDASAARLRDIIAATRFVPARKDGRAVKSRIVLSVNLGSEKRDP